MQDVVNLISNVGFPIVITLIMFYFNETVSEKYLGKLSSDIDNLENTVSELGKSVTRIEVELTNNENQKETSTTVPDNKQAK